MAIFQIILQKADRAGFKLSFRAFHFNNICTEFYFHSGRYFDRQFSNSRHLTPTRFRAKVLRPLSFRGRYYHQERHLKWKGCKCPDHSALFGISREFTYTLLPGVLIRFKPAIADLPSMYFSLTAIFLFVNANFVNIAFLLLKIVARATFILSAEY